MMGHYLPLSILLFLGFLIELYVAYHDYYTPIPATVPSITSTTLEFTVANYLDFIANKTIVLNALDVIKCSDGTQLRLRLRNKNNIWRFEHMYGTRFIPFRVIANSILYGFGIVAYPFALLYIYCNNTVTLAFYIAAFFSYQTLESVLSFIVMSIIIIVPDPDKPPTVDLQPLLRLIKYVM